MPAALDDNFPFVLSTSGASWPRDQPPVVLATRKGEELHSSI